jgi:hypothetical protein
MRATNLIKCTVLTLALVSTISCFGERDTRLSIEGGNPPRFTMYGSGKLDTLRVGGPKKQREGRAEDPYLYWVIAFKSAGSERYVESLGPITYGEVPSGYVQVFPRPDESLPVLSEDELYNLNAVTMTAMERDSTLRSIRERS